MSRPELPRASIVRAPIDPAAVLAEVGDAGDGAVLLFLGTVRDHADGRAVSGMEYDAYEEMAADVLRLIADEAAARLGTPRVVVVHRVGELAIGEVSVAIAVSSPHRDTAYDASRFVIEEIKRRLPVWKHERFLAGEARWVEGHPLAAPGPSKVGQR
jgi:molybdopterin synthase catalytic subunit